MRFVVAALVACGSPQSTESARDRDREAPPDREAGPSFCDALAAHDQIGATEAMHGALVDSGASKQRDATDALVAWLRAQPCASAVDVDPVLIDVDPPVRRLNIVVRAGGANRVMCGAELRLAPGAQVALIACKPMAGA